MEIILTFALCKEVIEVDFSTSQTLAGPPPTETRNLPSGLHETPKPEVMIKAKNLVNTKEKCIDNAKISLKLILDEILITKL